MKQLRKIAPSIDKEKILSSLSIDGEGIGFISAVEADLPLSRQFLLNLLSDFASGKKNLWQLKDEVDVFCTLQETSLMDDLKRWEVETTGLSLTVFITQDQINAHCHPFIIEWAVLWLLRNPAVYKISVSDVFTIRKFLMVSSVHLEEAFENWSHYWHDRRLDQDKAS